MTHADRVKATLNPFSGKIRQEIAAQTGLTDEQVTRALAELTANREAYAQTGQWFLRPQPVRSF